MVSFCSINSQEIKSLFKKNIAWGIHLCFRYNRRRNLRMLWAKTNDLNPLFYKGRSDNNNQLSNVGANLQTVIAACNGRLLLFDVQLGLTIMRNSNFCISLPLYKNQAVHDCSLPNLDTVFDKQWLLIHNSFHDYYRRWRLWLY